MARSLRPYAPGSFFHLMARTQNRALFFDRAATKDRIVEFIFKAIGETDTRVCAFVVMDNHLHLVVRQGADPLARLMQSILRRCALLVQRERDVEGHVFERKYHHVACRDPDTLRTWIRYVHRNPVKALYCTSPADYAWSSHHWWAQTKLASARPQLLILPGLFATSAGESSRALCANYSAFVDAAIVSNVWPGYLNDAWTAMQNQVEVGKWTARPRQDLAVVIETGLKELCPDADIEMVRVLPGAFFTAVRRQLVERAAKGGHKGCKIARYLHMSESSVSRIVRTMLARDQGLAG